MRITLSAPVELVELAEQDGPTRTIQGLAVPWNVDAFASTGPVRFLPGSLPVDGPAPKLFRHHDPFSAIGVVTERVEVDNGMMFSARISETAAGNEALTLAADGVIDAVSVGVELEEWTVDAGVTVVSRGAWRELSLVPWGAFSEARVLDVAAAEPEPEPAPETEPDPEPETDPEELTMSETAPNPITAELAPPSIGRTVLAMMRGERPHVSAATGTVSDVPGVVPMPLVGEVWTTMTAARPIIAEFGTSSMPTGDPFYARKITQHTSVAIQAAEHDTLASQAFQVSRITVDKVTLGGFLDVSEQEIANASDDVISAIVADMARAYALASERWFGDTILFGNAGTATATVTDWKDGDDVVTTLAAAAAEIKSTFGELPTHLIIKSATWAELVAAKDSGGNRTFPYLAPSNASGTTSGVTSLAGNPLGLRMIVSDDWDITLGTSNAMILSPRSVRLFEDLRGALRVEQPATLSTRLAYRGYVAAADYDIVQGVLLV